MKHIHRFLSTLSVLALLLGVIPAQPAFAVNTAHTVNADEYPDQSFTEAMPLDIGFLVSPDQDQIHAYHWLLGALVTVNIDDPSTPEEVDYTDSAIVVDDNVEYTTLFFDFSENFDIQAGFIVSLSDGVTTKTHTVTPLAIKDIDADLKERVTGVAEPNSIVYVWGCWDDGCVGSREEIANKKGNWTSDFRDDSQITYDFVAGSWAVATQWDEDGDGTLFGGSVPEPVAEPTPNPEADPVLLAPENGSVLTISIPNFQWEETVDAAGYQLKLSDSNGDEVILEWYELGIDVICAEGICTFTPDFVLPNDTYEWNVRPWENDPASWYAPFSFAIDVPLPDPDPPSGNNESNNQPEIGDVPGFNWQDIDTSAWLGSSGPGLHATPLIAGQDIEAGTVSVWNTKDQFFVQVDTADGWLINTIQIYIGSEPVPTVKSGNPNQGKFPYKEEYDDPTSQHVLALDLEDDLGFIWGHWGEPFEDLRLRNIAVHADLVKLDENEQARGTMPKSPRVLEQEGAWAYGDGTFEGARWAWWFQYEMAHPQRAHFIDSPVGGISFLTPTHVGKTDESGGFDYYPGETVNLSIGSVSLGSALIAHKISPLDIYEDADLEDPRVINMARLLQSLDYDASPKDGIIITDDVVACLDQTVAALGLTGVDFANDAQTEAVIQNTISQCAGIVELVSVSAEDAIANLDRSLNSNMFRKNVSRTPDYASSKSKLNIMGVWFPALRANGEATTVEYYDENGALIRLATEAKPVVVAYTDGVDPVGYEDIFAGISRDDGKTFKRMNLSRAADRTSFTLANGLDYYGDAKKPVFQVKGNNILVSWTSKYCNGGKPAYAIDPADDYMYDDAYYTEDIWGVSGPQRSVDYAELGFPEVGEVPYSCVWVARGVVATQENINAGLGDYVGDIVWFKPERLTSGRRDANQVFMGASDGAGFAIAWQEDPEGLRPGGADGPGPGWGGATTNHKTDIWYSYITMSDFGKVDTHFVSGGDPEHEIEGRLKALVPMSLPVRITDNDAVNTDNMMVELDAEGYPVVDEYGDFIPTDSISSTSNVADVSYADENLTRCVKFEGGETIVEKDSLETATYRVLPTLSADHQSTMNCINCHVPYGLDPHDNVPTQGAPIPLVVIDALTPEYLGGYTNADCVSCHYNNEVPRDRVIAVSPGADEVAKVSECESKGGVWKDELEAYYPYEGYPYLPATEDDSAGTHTYAYELPGLCESFYEFTNNQGALKRVCVTEDNRLLNGDTGASRPNLFLQTYTKPDGSKSAWAIMAYEESKGIGSGAPDHEPGGGPYGDDYIAEEGKNSFYHSFDLQSPDLVSAGTVINLPERDENGNLIYVKDEAGSLILDWLGQPQLAYENARRPRFILQGKSAMGSSGTVLLILYKEGQEGSGRPSDIMLRRIVAPSKGNPYAPENIVCNTWVTANNGLEVCIDGSLNMSSVTPTVTTDSTGDPQVDDPYGAVKVVEWIQTTDNFNDFSWTNPYDDARAHRGSIRGDFVVMGFSYTPNWAAARNGNDKYDLFIRRSFDGGQTWTTDPAGEGVTHCNIWTYPSGTQSAGTKIEDCNTYASGAFEQMHNVSQLPNNKSSVIEPRIVAPPGTIKIDGVWTGKLEDKQNPNMFYVSYGTSTNPKKDPVTGEQEEPHPLDLYYSFSLDQGETYVEVAWDVNPDSDGNFAGETVYRWDYLAKGDSEQGEAQLRMTPDGSRFYATWLQEGEEGSDIWFRRIMSPAFSVNNAQ